MGAPLRVLVVEDSEDDAELLLRELERGGCEVQSERVETPEAMTSALERGKWDIVISDYKMPRFNGLAALKLLQKMELDLPFILVSGTVGEDVAVDAMKAGAHDYLMKGNLARLVPAVERELREAEVRRERKRVGEEERRKTQDLAFLAKTALEFAAFPPEEDIYRHIAERLHEITGAAAVFVNSIDEDSRLLQCRAAVGPGKFSRRVLKLIGRDPVGMRFPLSEEADRGLKEGKLVKVPGGLYGLALGEVPKTACAAIEKLLGLGDIYAVGATTERMLFASASIATRAGTEIRSRATIETFISQAAVALQHRLAEEALRESEEKLRSLVEHAPVIIMTVERDGTIQFINRTVPGLTVEEVIGTTIYDYTPPEYHGTLRQCVEHVFETGEVSSYETAGVGPDGSTSWYSTHVAPILSGDQIVATTHVCRDITDRKRAEEEKEKLQAQLLQAQKMEAVGRLAGGVAHDFNNLLTIITGYSALTLKGLDERDPMRADLEGIERAAERAAGLTRQLLAFSRRQVLRPKVIGLNTVVAEMEKMLRRLIGEDVELTTVLGTELGQVKADPGQIEQVIMNLAINARDAMPKGGKLTVETRNVELDEAYVNSHFPVQPGSYVMIAVSDTGCGMDEETRSHVFDPFFTTKEEGKGTGLGLSTVYGIVKQSDGYIWVYSEPGQGTTLKIYLPRVAETTEVPQPSAAAESERGSGTVVLVEDEDAVRAVALRILEMNGYTVLEARNGGEALLICEEHKGQIGLMITDVVMPGMSGPELFERLASVRPEMRVLFMSGYTDEAIVHHGVLEPGTEFIEKPFTPDALARKVREVLDAPKEEKQ